MRLTCFLCGKQYDPNALQNTCECGRPLRVDYDLSASVFTKEALKDRKPTLWRYREVLPPCPVLTLGEGLTPLQPVPNLGKNWFIKDESINPTGSFKARGMAVAVSRAKQLGATKLAVPTAGNAGGALSAYAAKAGLEANVFMPADTPKAFQLECRLHGANLTLVNGLINDCGAEIAKLKTQNGWFDMSTLKEPYRAEGKKTMGYELAEQMDWRLPDAIVYPCGGGTGLVGMWKAFDEMERLGWIGRERPRMYAVQAEHCAPIVNAFQAGERFATKVENAKTIASGLRVPVAVGDFILLDLIKRSRGQALVVSDVDMVETAKEISSKTGISASPEGGGALAGARHLLTTKEIKEHETVVIFNTGGALKYAEAFGSA
jgi:threonine synthase